MCTGSSNNPDTFWYTHFPPLMRRTISLLIPWELGHQLLTSPVRTTLFAPAVAETNEQPGPHGYSKPAVAATFKVDRFSGQDFTHEGDGTLHCPAHQSLVVHERRKEADGSFRLVYAASIRSRRPCPLRKPRQWSGAATAKPRQGSRLVHPMVVGSSPLLWRDWSRREHREACIQLLRHQRVEVKVQPAEATLTGPFPPLSRAERAQYRLSWEERLARNASALASGQVTIQLIARPRTLCRCSRSGQCVGGHSSCLSFSSDRSVSPSRTSLSLFRPSVALFPLWFCSLTGRVNCPAPFPPPSELLTSSTRSLCIPWERKNPQSTNYRYCCVPHW